jgi:hypothetical protein
MLNQVHGVEYGEGLERKPKDPMSSAIPGIPEDYVENFNLPPQAFIPDDI